MRNINWSELVFQLEQKGISPEMIANRLNVSRQSIYNYRDKGRKPMYEHGIELVELWISKYLPKNS